MFACWIDACNTVVGASLIEEERLAIGFVGGGEELLVKDDDDDEFDNPDSSKVVTLPNDPFFVVMPIGVGLLLPLDTGGGVNPVFFVTLNLRPPDFGEWTDMRTDRTGGEIDFLGLFLGEVAVGWRSVGIFIDVIVVKRL